MCKTSLSAPRLVWVISACVCLLISVHVTAPALASAPVTSAQTTAQVWPPGGAAISPLPVTLPAGRFVPSTKRWNLVWADQIIPNWVTPAQVQFAAQHYAGTQKIWNWQADEFRAINPNFLILTYHLAAGLNPQSNSDCPDPKTETTGFIGVIAPVNVYTAEWPVYFSPWLQSHGITAGSARYEALFQHYDAQAQANRVWHLDPYWLMNVDNLDWRHYMTDTLMLWMSGNQNEGTFLDVAVETQTYLYNPNEGNPAPRNFDWWRSPHAPYGFSPIPDLAGFAAWQNARFRPYFQELLRRFHAGATDYLVVPNVDQMVTGWYDPAWMDGDAAGEAIDGAMMEGFGNYTGADMYLTLERGVRHITGRGKILIAQFGADSPGERLRRAGMYMLIKNENSFLNILNDSGVEWYPEYEIDLGDQSPMPASLASLRVAGSGDASLWRRNYANGMVLCNTSDDAMNYALPATRRWARVSTSGGGNVNDSGTPAAQSIIYTPVSGTISVPGSGCVILRSVGVYVPVVRK